MSDCKSLAASPQVNGLGLSPADREELLLSYWLRGNLTPLDVANSLARSGSNIAFARDASGIDVALD